MASTWDVDLAKAYGGAIATLIRLLGADTCVRAVRWESNPQGA